MHRSIQGRLSVFRCAKHREAYPFSPMAKDGQLIIEYDRANAFPGMHQLKGAINITQGHGVRDQVIDIDLLIHIPVDDLRHIGATSGTAKGCTTP